MNFHDFIEPAVVADLFWTHYGELAVVVSDVSESQGPEMTLGVTGWQAPFQGGGNSHFPSDFIFLYANAYNGEDENGEEFNREGYIHLLSDPSWQDGRGGADEWFSFDPWVLVGLDEETVRDFLLDFRKKSWSTKIEGFRCVRAEEVSKYVRALSAKAIGHVRQSYGQGHQFFKLEAEALGLPEKVIVIEETYGAFEATVTVVGEGAVSLEASPTVNLWEKGTPARLPLLVPPDFFQGLKGYEKDRAVRIVSVDGACVRGDYFYFKDPWDAVLRYPKGEQSE